MTERENDVSKFDALISEHLTELVAYRQNTWAWLKTDHSISDTQTRLQELQLISGEISELAAALVEQRSGGIINAKQLESNLRTIGIVRSYEQDIQECLNRDIDAKRKAASDNKVNVVQNAAFILTVPGLFVTGVKNGVGNGHIDVNEAIILGFAVSVPTVFHKSVRRLFSKAAKDFGSVPATLQAVPAYVGNDMRVVYAKAVVKEATNNAQVCFASVAKSINDNANATCIRIKSGFGKLLGRRGPRP